ncbi:hypothetical protein Y032_0133g1746 [Ancylostoma ceylanicum]|uniref:Sushi domain-containing protein n=1 Tax=Ancylostoma ceylanicum TaxID=53326 RepID=A0A016T665_9BILA|nr:hypothetical protein Y032_0133g1746 [Ancylostoma ceylanicum]
MPELRHAGDCPPPNIPNGIIVDYHGPYTDGATINGRCQGNGYIMGPSSMTCLFGNWVPPFMGQCSNGLQYSCPTPRAPQGAHLSSQGPFGNGDMVQAICDDGGYILGPSSMACVMGHWAPAFFGDCTSSQRYSCQIPSPKPGMALSRQGTVRSDESVTATCTQNNKVLLGIKSMTCVFGHWAPNQFGDCVDVNQLGTVVYSDGSGLVIVKYRNGTDIKDLGNGVLMIQYSSGGYGIEQVRGYTGVPGISMAGGMTGVQVRNGIVYINGVAVAKRIGELYGLSNSLGNSLWFGPAYHD